MRITLIGAGRVATHLAKVLQLQHQIVQIFSRNLQHAQTLADQVNAQAIDDVQQLDAQTDLVIIAVSDQAIHSVIDSIAPHLAEKWRASGGCGQWRTLAAETCRGARRTGFPAGRAWTAGLAPACWKT